MRSYELGDGFLKGFRKASPPITVTVATVTTERHRKPNKDDGWWNVNVDSEIVELTTNTATLEWAAYQEVEVRVEAPAEF